MRSKIVAALVAAGLAVAPNAHAVKIGAGLVAAGGELGDGARGGFQVGAYFGFPSVERLSIGADVSWFPVRGGTLFAVDPNVHLNLVQLPILDVYPLAGVDVLYAGAAGYDNVAIGLLVGAGAEVKAGPLRPYVDFKAAFHESTYVALSGGLRIKF